MAKACIICGEEVASGRPVQDDAVIKAIRAVKQSLGVARNNELVVCGGHMEAYQKKRQAYERKLAVYAVISAAVLAFFIFLPIFTTGFSLYSSFAGFALAAFVMLLAVVTSHTPRIGESAPSPPHAPKARSRGRKGGK
jgi:hypothetical protein